MIRRFCAYVLKFKDCDGFTHSWCTPCTRTGIGILKIHSCHCKTNSFYSRKRIEFQIIQDYLRKDLVGINLTASSSKQMLGKARNHAVRFMEESFPYAEDKWDKSNATPDFKVGDLVLVSTTNFNKIKGCKNLKDSFEGPFVDEVLQGQNSVELQLSEELTNNNPKLLVRFIKPYKYSDAEKFPLINKVPQCIPPFESCGTKKITKVLKERK
ncbi:hypothetical protein O181_076053 [Austropuccinia psidii MF-1]|uniref:Uncharacterized protein n=1 Tax=Austropuccinia psidii MF-1 TaxID=1389203 RepID=A0A9Q3FE70_9BASI|nr:hypothetical protein [Austropuccinia psidii MF-1]